MYFPFLFWFQESLGVCKQGKCPCPWHTGEREPFMLFFHTPPLWQHSCCSWTSVVTPQYAEQASWRACADTEFSTTEPWHKIELQVAAFTYVNSLKFLWNLTWVENWAQWRFVSLKPFQIWRDPSQHICKGIVGQEQTNWSASLARWVWPR